MCIAEQLSASCEWLPNAARVACQDADATLHVYTFASLRTPRTTTGEALRPAGAVGLYTVPPEFCVGAMGRLTGTPSWLRSMLLVSPFPNIAPLAQNGVPCHARQRAACLPARGLVPVCSPTGQDLPPRAKVHAPLSSGLRLRLLRSKADRVYVPGRRQHG